MFRPVQARKRVRADLHSHVAVTRAAKPCADRWVQPFASPCRAFARIRLDPAAASGQWSRGRTVFGPELRDTPVRAAAHRRRRHVGRQQSSMSSRSAILVGCHAGGLARRDHRTRGAGTQGCPDPGTPLVLKAQGSFFVGGEKADETQAELGNLGPGGHITVNQMYVRYMVPQGGDGNVPVVMVHGATLTGKSWETTPDGRMGWDEYFVRKGHPVYVPDQVGRGRSGFNQAVFNDVRAGTVPPASQPAWLRFSDESRLAELPLRFEAWRPVPGQSVSGERRRRTREAGGAGRQFWRRRTHSQPDAQGVGRSRRSSRMARY